MSTDNGMMGFWHAERWYAYILLSLLLQVVLSLTTFLT